MVPAFPAGTIRGDESTIKTHALELTLQKGSWIRLANIRHRGRIFAYYSMATGYRNRQAPPILTPDLPLQLN